MAVCSSSLSVLSINSVPKTSSSTACGTRVRVLEQRSLVSVPLKFYRNSTRLNAGLSEIEPDLNEDPRDRWATNGVSPEDFIYGEYDGHHTYYEGQDKGTFWESVAEDYAAVEPPSGFQGLISWLFLPAVVSALYFHAPGEYLYIGAAIFTVVFCIIEMNKPDKPHNFEPQIYNMERGSRDKLIADYNTMDIWDFNEKYGDIWDFTVKKNDIMNR